MQRQDDSVCIDIDPPTEGNFVLHLGDTVEFSRNKPALEIGYIRTYSSLRQCLWVSPSKNLFVTLFIRQPFTMKTKAVQCDEENENLLPNSDDVDIRVHSRQRLHTCAR
jgi:hypothetical protein